MVEFKFKRGQLLFFTSNSATYRIVDKKVDGLLSIDAKTYKLKNVRREGRPGKGEIYRTERGILRAIENKEAFLVGSVEMAKILYGKL